jgi:phosphate starvation-inducible protein PhoH and related proteins
VSKRRNGVLITDEEVFLDKKQTAKFRITDLREFDPLTANQRIFFDAYDSGDYFLMLSGSAGTGKTFIAFYKAIREVLDKATSFNRVVIVRSAVQSRDMGFTPGSVEEKMSLYEQPYMQICSQFFGRRNAYEELKDQHKVEFISTSFIRGMSFDDAIIIVDECQNLNWEELSTIMTRVGYRSKIIFCGDYRQSDLHRKKNDSSGLMKFHTIAKRMSSFTNIEFTTDDIVRSSLVKDFLIAVDNYEKENNC